MLRDVLMEIERTAVSQSKLFSPHLIFILPVMFSLQPPLSSANDTISAGHPLVGDDRLVSRNGKFALGFFQTGGDSSNNTVNWYVGIWFSTVSELTPVWAANVENPVSDPTLSELKISDDGNLAILNQSKSMVWSSQANITSKSTVAVILDDGNLVLRDMSNSSEVLWQSFDHLTDTLLPGSKLGRNKVTGLNRRLVSKKNLMDPAPGIYIHELGPDGSSQFVLLWNMSKVYWTTGNWTGKIFTAVPEMTQSTSYTFRFVNNDHEEYFMYSVNSDSIITRLVMDVSGQTRQLSWAEDARKWVLFYSEPKAQCDVYAICGPFAICNENTLPFCSCMKGFSVRSPGDWDLGDRTGGCARNTPLQCGSDHNATTSTDKFYAMPGVRLPENGDSMEVTTVQECELACLSSCSCTAYSYVTGCSLWHGGLLNLQDQYNGTVGGTLYLRLAAAELPDVKSNNRGLIITLVAAGSASFLVSLAIVLVLFWRNRREQSVCHVGNGLVAFRYFNLQRATRNFSEKLGQGGFGSVFKGCLPDSATVAVKKLNGFFQGEKQFRAEVSSIGTIHHINLVRLLGFCSEGKRRLLVYEYMPNGSLDIHLFRSNPTFLNWTTRYQIALGVAKGLAYLHENCRDCIIHCDIKPENILLDASFVPKIADFGMAKFLGRDFSRVLTTMRGTVGYLAPEWITGMAITAKVDVYSYGMMLLEIISGRRNSQEDDNVFFPTLAANKLLEGNVECLVDEKLHRHADMAEVERICKVACWCIQEDEFSRPTMGQVVQILEGLSDVNMPPMPRLLRALAGSPYLARTPP